MSNEFGQTLVLDAIEPFEFVVCGSAQSDSSSTVAAAVGMCVFGGCTCKQVFAIDAGDELDNRVDVRRFVLSRTGFLLDPFGDFGFDSLNDPLEILPCWHLAVQFGRDWYRSTAVEV